MLVCSRLNHRPYLQLLLNFGSCSVESFHVTRSANGSTCDSYVFFFFKLSRVRRVAICVAGLEMTGLKKERGNARPNGRVLDVKNGKIALFFFFLRHMNSVLRENSRSCFVCHCATQLKLEGVESSKHACGL